MVSPHGHAVVQHAGGYAVVQQPVHYPDALVLEAQYEISAARADYHHLARSLALFREIEVEPGTVRHIEEKHPVAPPLGAAHGDGFAGAARQSD